MPFMLYTSGVAPCAPIHFPLAFSVEQTLYHSGDPLRSSSPRPMQISPTLGVCSSPPPISLCSGIWSLFFSTQSGAAWACWLILPELRSDRHGSNAQQRSKDASDWPGIVDGKTKCFTFKFVSRIVFIINYELVWWSFTDNKRLK